MGRFLRVGQWLARNPIIESALFVMLVGFGLAGIFRVFLWVAPPEPPKSPVLLAAFVLVSTFLAGVGLRPVMLRGRILVRLIRCLDLLFSSVAEYKATIEALRRQLQWRRNQIRRLKKRLRQTGRSNGRAPPGHGRFSAEHRGAAMHSERV